MKSIVDISMYLLCTLNVHIVLTFKLVSLIDFTADCFTFRDNFLTIDEYKTLYPGT